MGRAWPVRKADLTIRWQLGLHEVYHHGFSLSFLDLMTIFVAVCNKFWLSLAVCKGRLFCWHYGASYYAGFNAEVHWHLYDIKVFGHMLSIISLRASWYHCHFGNGRVQNWNYGAVALSWHFEQSDQWAALCFPPGDWPVFSLSRYRLRRSQLGMFSFLLILIPYVVECLFSWLLLLIIITVSNCHYH